MTQNALECNINSAKQTEHLTPATGVREIIVCSCLNTWVCAENYVKLRYFVTIIFLVTLQGRVCTHAPRQVKWIALTITVQHSLM